MDSDIETSDIGSRIEYEASKALKGTAFLYKRMYPKVSGLAALE
jgi:hypothetical protein